MSDTERIWFSVAMIVAPALVLGATGAGAGLVLAVGAVCSIGAAFLNLDRFSRISAAGFSADVREARQLVSEAREISAELHTVARLALVSDIERLAWANRMGGMSIDEADRHERLTRAVQVAGELGLDSDAELKRALADFHRLRGGDLLRRFVNYCERDGGLFAAAIANELRDRANFSRQGDLPSEGELRRRLVADGVTLDSEAERLLAIYLHYLEHQEPAEILLSPAAL